MIKMLEYILKYDLRSEVMLQVKNVFKTYESSGVQTQALRGVSLKVSEGEFVAITGASGSGKSTLFNIIGGLDQADSGEIIIDGSTIKNADFNAMTIYRRRKIGFIFQQYNLIPTCSVYDNIVLPLLLDDKPISRSQVTELSDMLGITEKLDQYPLKLSGGQQQRVAIARALMTKPKLILADEPTGNLDSETSAEVIALLRQSAQKWQQTVLLITHDRQIAASADRVIEMKDGRVLQGTIS